MYMNGQLNIDNFTNATNVMNSTSGNHTAISGGRKQTADHHAYTLYKPNNAKTRGKFSNGGGSMSGANDGNSFDGSGYGSHNNSFIGESKHMNTSNYGTNPNTTASRFYNPKQSGSPHQNNLMNETQSRFMQNL